MTLAEYNKCVDLYADSIYRFVLKQINNEDKAKDIIQDVFEKVWLKVESISFEKIKSYLFSAAYRTMIDDIRKNSKQTNFNPEADVHPNHNKHYSDLKDILNDALNQLPEIQKSVTMLRDYEGYSYQEIGEITNLSEAQVKVYIYRARKFLQKYLVSVDTII